MGVGVGGNKGEIKLGDSWDMGESLGVKTNKCTQKRQSLAPGKKKKQNKKKSIKCKN